MFEYFTHLALDQAPRVTGWALGAPDMREPLTGTLKFPAVGARHGKILAMMSNWLDTMITVYPLEKVVFETPFLARGPASNPATFALQNKLIGVIEARCDLRNVRCTEITATKWRDRFIGQCLAPRSISKSKRRDWLKEQAMAACRGRNWFVESHDAAEACGILDYALATDFPAYGATSSPLFVKGAAA